MRPLRIMMGMANLDSFLALSDAIYRNDPWYCTPPPEKIRAGILRKDFSGRQEIFLIFRGSQPIARAVARIAPALQDTDGRPYGMIGFFEALEDPEATRALFQTAVSWLTGRGASAIIGPIDGDTWHSYRLNVGPRDQPPFLMEPYQPLYYQRLWEDFGFIPMERYYSKVVFDLPAALAGTDKVSRRALAHGYVLRSIQMADFRNELKIIYDLSCAMFADNFLYAPISFDEFAALYSDVRRLIDPDLVWFVLEPKGEPIGFIFALVDNIRALRALKSGRSLLALTRFFFLRGRSDTVNAKTIGVLPKYRGVGLSVLLIHKIYQVTLAKGFRRINLCLIRESNSSGRLDGGHGQLFRHYVLYQLHHKDVG